MSAWLTERNLPYRDSQAKAYSTDANIWGATHEAKNLEHLDVSLETVEPIMGVKLWDPSRSEEHTSELQSLMRISYAVFCLINNTQRKRLLTLTTEETLQNTF